MIIYLTFFLFSSGLLITAAFYDFFRLRIPNIIPIAIALAFFIAYAGETMADKEFFQPLSSHLKAGGIIFLIMLALFFMNTIGGGDAKLLPAIALWVGTEGLSDFILWTIFAGFPLAIIALVLKNTSLGNRLALKISSHPWFLHGWIKALANRENVVPYGMAIATGGLMTFYSLSYLP